MQVQFEKREITCLGTPVREVQNCEQTQQIPLSDAMGDIGRIVSAWGQVILRGKEWQGDRISFSGGVMVWVLYEPEDGSPAQCIDSWIPFQMKWDLPEDCQEGQLRIRCMPRIVDARSVSPRKILVRAGVTALAEAFVPETGEVSQPEKVPEGLELLESTYPLRLQKEAGEKSFLMDEELTVPEGMAEIEKLVYFQVNPRILEKKVMANKAVFRGSGNLHVLYKGEDGGLHGADFELPFSQYTDLEGEYGGEAQADFALMVSSLEVEVDDEGHLRAKCAVVAQYLITDRELVTLVEDAYSPSREVESKQESLELPALLDSRRESLYAEQSLPTGTGGVVDLRFLPDFPRQRRSADAVELEIPGCFQLLAKGEDGSLRGSNLRWEGHMRLNADESSSITAVPTAMQPTADMGSLKAELSMELTTSVREKLDMVTEVVLGEARTLDPARPTLVLKRAGKCRLWEMAKACGSTVDAIRRANGLQGEPEAGQMLLIPVS